YARYGNLPKAYSYFKKTVNLDIDDIHHNAFDGIHTACMGGSMMTLMHGFARLRVREDGIYFESNLPKQITEINFKMNYKKSELDVKVTTGKVVVKTITGPKVKVVISGEKQTV